MVDQKKKIIVYVMLAFLCAILFSTSGVFVIWLEDSFTPIGQLTVRATISLVVSLTWAVLEGFISKKNPLNLKEMSKKYNKWHFLLISILRPAGNFCFIMAITTANVTLAVMILLFVKMISNVAVNSIREKRWPDKLEMFGYLLVTLGILIYGLSSKEVVFTTLLFWAVGSGIAEAVRLEVVNKMQVRKDKPTFAVIEFTGMLIVALTVLFFFRQTIFIPGIVAISQISWWGIALATSAVGIVALDYYLVNYLPTGIYSAILATEVGFAGLLNYFAFKNEFGLLQILALTLTIVANVVIGKAVSDREKKKYKNTMS